MSAFRKGDTVVHPEHGAAVIEELKDKEFLRFESSYLPLSGHRDGEKLILGATYYEGLT